MSLPAGAHRPGASYQKRPAAADSSSIHVTLGAPDWSSDAGKPAVIGPFRARATTSALCAPVASIRIVRAARIRATPMVRPRRITRCSPPNSRAASDRVTGCSSVSRVGSARASARESELGSFQPIWPLRPSPKSWRSIPPSATAACTVDWILRAAARPAEPASPYTRIDTQARSTVRAGLSMRGTLRELLSSRLENQRRVKIAQRNDRRSEWSDRGGLQAFAWIDSAALGTGPRRGLRGKLATQQPQCDLDGVGGIVLAPLGIE